VSPPTAAESTQRAEPRAAVSDEERIPGHCVSPSNRCGTDSGGCLGVRVIHGAGSKVDPGARESDPVLAGPVDQN
jgi:hypothetical protein